MSNETKKFFCPRLIDYVIIVGCKEPCTPAQLASKQIAPDQPATQLPELLRRYPFEDHDDFMLPQDVIYFCQPEGCCNINCSTQQKANSNRETTSFIFSLTEKDSARVRYGVCINFFRPIEKKIKQRKSSIDKSNQQNINETDDDDTNKRDNSNPDKQTHKPFKKKTKRNKKASDVKYTHTLTSLCIISHHPFFSIFRECLNILRRIIESCHARSLAAKPTTPSSTSNPTIASILATSTSNKLVRDTVWGILTGSCGTISTEQISSLVACEIREIETWILRLLSAPVPVPGRTKLIIDILPNEAPMLFALPDHTRFNLVDFPLHLPLELLGAETCIKVITLILLENKLLFQSSDYNALTMSIMAFVAMLYPLEYMFPIIPLLPRCMNETEQLLLAPTPFLIGIPASFFQYKSNIELPDDVWLVDLDKNRIINPRHGDPIPELPEPEHTILRNHLNQALTSLSSSPQPVKNFESFFSQHQSKEEILQSFNPLIYGNDVDSVDVATRITMVQFLTSKNILGGFNEHTRILRLYPRPVVAFQYNSFIRSRPIKSNFIIKMGRSQAVEYLAEWSLCPNNVAYLRIQTGIFDPSLIGDKPKWYCRYLTPIQFKTYEEKSTLAAAIQFLKQEQTKLKTAVSTDCPTDDSNEDEYYSSSSSNSLAEENDAENTVNSNQDENDDNQSNETQGHVYYSPDGKLLGMFPKNQANTMCVDVEQVYSPPINHERSPSVASSRDDTSPITSSASSCSINSAGVDETPTSADLDELDLNMNVIVDEVKLPKQRPSRIAESKSSNATPVNKNFPKLPFDSLTSSSNSSVHSSTNDLVNKREQQKVRTSSQSSSSTITARSINKLKEIKQSINNISVNSTGSTSTIKKSSMSLISQLSDDLTNKTKNIAKTNKRLAGLIGDEQPELPQSHSNSNLKDRNNNNINQVETSNTLNLPYQPAIPESDSMNLPPTSQIQNQEVSELSSENQQFLNDVITSVLDGQGVGYFKNNKIKRLMEDENNRNFVLSRLNSQLDKKLANDEEHIEDVKISRAVFKGMSKLLQLIIQGLEQTYANNGLGGMASAFQLLEIAHTHYWLHSEEMNTKTSVGSSSVTTSGNQGNSTHNDGSMSPMSDHSGSPFDSKENLNSITNNNGNMSTSSSVYSLSSKSKHNLSNEQFQIQSTSSIVAQLGSLWSNSKLNSFTKSLVSHTSSLPFTSTTTSTSLNNSQSSNLNNSINANTNKSSVVSKIANNLSSMSNYSLSLTKSQSNATTTTLTSNSSTKTDAHLDDMEDDNSNHQPTLSSISSLSSPIDKNSSIHNLDDFKNASKRNSVSESIKSGGEQSSKNSKPKINHHTINPQTTQINESPEDLLFQQQHQQQQQVTTPEESSPKKVLTPQNSLTKSPSKLDLRILMIPKSTLSSGYRYTKGKAGLMRTITDADKRTYIFETLITNQRSPLWDQMQFWEDVFLDAVAQERDIIGLDQGPSEMMERYNQLGNAEKKRLELDEDHLLAVMLYNLISFMIMMKVSKDEIKRKIRRMLGKCHIGLTMSQHVNDLLDCCNILLANDVDLRPAGSRLMQKQCFTVHLGTDNKGDMLFMEVCDDCMILRSVKGEICQRWWFEKLVNMTYCPKTKVLCLWCKQNGETQLNKFYTKKCRELYFAIKEAMEKAVARLNSAIGSSTLPPTSELGGEFQIYDLKSNEQGTLEICMEGINLTFNDQKEFIELKRVRKCTTQKDDIFLLEEYDPTSKQIVIRRYKSTMASEAIFAFHRICSYQAAVLESKRTTFKAKKITSDNTNTSLLQN